MIRYKYRLDSQRKNNQIPVYIDGARSPFVKSFGLFEDTDPVDLFSSTIDGFLRRVDIHPKIINEIIAGVVIPQTKNPNIARDSILNLGLPKHIHGYTLNRACTSSLQAIINSMQSIYFGHPNMILVGGVECLSDVPIVYSREARKFMVKLTKAKSTAAKLNIIKNFKAKAWLPKPPALSEPLTGLTMGQHAEIMALKNGISRKEQDLFAVESHQKAAKAQSNKIFEDEIIPIWPSPKYQEYISKDNIIRQDTSIETMTGLPPVFDQLYGTLTAGNSSPLTDGASIGLITSWEKAKAEGLQAKCKLIDFDTVAVDPWDQLLIGPAITIPRLLARNGLKIEDIDRFEIHEAFAAQVLSCLNALESKSFSEKYFGKSVKFGSIPSNKINVNGGAIAIGHPFGATGMRLLSTLSNELIRSEKKLGLIAICAAGGMASSLLIENCMT